MKPLVLLSNPAMQSLTFYWPDHPSYWVGYRVQEGSPETSPQSQIGIDHLPAAEWGEFPTPGPDLLLLPSGPLPRKRWRTSYQEKRPDDPVRLTFRAYAGGAAWCGFREDGGMQQREFFFRPVEDGVEMWMRLATEIPIKGAYCVQQCLRFTGALNWSLRRQIARVPFLSELDVQAMGHPNLSLTYARQGSAWLQILACYLQFTTPAGRSLPGHAFAGEVDHGLIVRETLDRKKVPASYFRKTAPGETWDRIASGMYWERTAWVSNRHPADCLHAVVDLGPLPAGGSRTVHGKFYWIEGKKDDLLIAWQRDFPDRGDP